MTVFICIFLLSACTATAHHYTSTINSWRGADLHSLVNTWGVPDKKIVTPTGHILFVYYIQSYQNYAGPSSPSIGVHVNSTGSPVMTVTPNTNMAWNRGNMSLMCTAIFDATSTGYIINTQLQGHNCYVYEYMSKKMPNAANPSAAMNSQKKSAHV